MKIPFRLRPGPGPGKVKGKPGQKAEPPQHEASHPAIGYQREAEPAEKSPAPLPTFFMLSHLEDDGPVRIDGVKVGVCEVMGLEIDEPKLGAFAGALNALDFPLQLLVRQQPPGLEGMRAKLREAQPDGLPERTRQAAESLQRLLTDLEKRDGILDRRFYGICAADRLDDLCGLLSRAGLSVHTLGGRQLRMLLLPSALGGSPREMDEAEPVEIEVGRRDIRIGDRLTRSLHLGNWPRSLAPGFLQGLMAAGSPDGPFDTPWGDTRRTGRADAGVAEGALRVRAEPVAAARQDHVPGGGDSARGRVRACGTRYSAVASASSTPRCP